VPPEYFSLSLFLRLALQPGDIFLNRTPEKLGPVPFSHPLPYNESVNALKHILVNGHAIVFILRIM